MRIHVKNILAGIGTFAILAVAIAIVIPSFANYNFGSSSSDPVYIVEDELNPWTPNAPENDLVWSLIRVMKQEVPVKNSQNRFSFQYYYSKNIDDKIYPSYFGLKDIELNEDYKTTKGYEKLYNEGKIFSIPLISGDGNTYVIEEIENAPPKLSNYDTTYSCFVLGKGNIERNHFSGKGTKIVLTPQQILEFKLKTIPNDPVGEVIVCTFNNTKKILQEQSKILGE